MTLLEVGLPAAKELVISSPNSTWSFLSGPSSNRSSGIPGQRDYEQMTSAHILIMKRKLKLVTIHSKNLV